MGIDRMAVVGAGQMGSGIAQVAAQAGVEVVVADASPELAKRSVEKLAATLAKLVEKGKIPAAERDAVLGRIRAARALEDCAGADLAIEAIVENEGVKKEIFRRLDALLRPEAILASNTSSISITALAAATKRPDRFVGMHFMNPPPVMQLVEIIRGLQTSDATYAAVVALAKRFRKTTVTSKDSPGFIVNRILIPLLNEACFALQEGLARRRCSGSTSPRAGSGGRAAAGSTATRGDMAYENLLFQVEDGIAVLTFNRPKALNALNSRTLAELDALLQAEAREPAVRALVLTGAGDKAFVAGADTASDVASRRATTSGPPWRSAFSSRLRTIRRSRRGSSRSSGSAPSRASRRCPSPPSRR